MKMDSTDWTQVLDPTVVQAGRLTGLPSRGGKEGRQNQKRIFIPVHIPGHFMLVILDFCNNQAWLGDPLITYGEQYHLVVRESIDQWAQEQGQT